MEALKIRPRIRIGCAHQMTFLSGSRSSVERSHRRAMGITHVDEVLLIQQLLETSIQLQVILGSPSISYIVQLGADLDEWHYTTKGDTWRCFSSKWAKREDSNLF